MSKRERAPLLKEKQFFLIDLKHITRPIVELRLPVLASGKRVWAVRENFYRSGRRRLYLVGSTAFQNLQSAQKMKLAHLHKLQAALGKIQYTNPGLAKEVFDALAEYKKTGVVH